MQYLATAEQVAPSIFSGITLSALFRSLLLIFGVVPLIFLASRVASKYFGKTHSSQVGMVTGKAIRYVGFIIVLLTVLHELGFSLAPLLGAAGIVGIAIGFASQTTISNIISGLFLITEQPFVVDDTIQVGDIVGQVLSIDILSIKIRTLDNKLVRIPNETILKGTVTNITFFPVRRLDLNIAIAYKESIAKVRPLLLDIAFKNPLCLQEPEPMVRYNGFGGSSQDLMLSIWVEKGDFLALKNKMYEEIKARFDAEGIEIALPHLSLYAGTASKPFPIQLVPAEEKKIADEIAPPENGGTP